MKYLLPLLMCASLAQAQLKPEIFASSEPGAFLLLWKPQTGQEEMKWSLAPNQSKLQWMGKPIAGGGHEGTIQFISGSVTVSATGLITQGELVVDMNTIKSTDIKPESSAKDLEDHLKSDDFFSVAKYPRANFSILKVIPEAGFTPTQKAKVTGLLTIKGITNQVTFPATIIREKGEFQVKAELTIDRTKWDIIYQSKSIFTNLKDGIISDEIKITVDLKFVGC
ncbi:MAG: YceI family protein [Cyclobacteriaceae bacterium]|nr:YceI family protein [Cyclobacteriaceae bacterium]